AERPWYNSQTPPPALLTAPDEPIRLILPEDSKPRSGATARAYEEALPKATYSPPVSAPFTLPPAIKLGEIIPPTANPPPLSGPIATWQKFAVPVSADTSRPSIAIVIDDAGIDHIRTARAIALPAPLTIAFLTYASDLKRQTEAARRAGHELMVHVAMEPTNKDVDPGPRPLLTSLTETELLSRLDWVLSRFSGYAGINNHMGSRFTQDPPAMRIVLTELKRRGLLFLDSRTSSQTVSRSIAAEIDLAFAERNVFLDHEPKREVVEAQLRALEREARRRGHAIAIGHPRDATLDALAAWIPAAETRGFHLTTVGSMVASRRGIKLAASDR
ncbi:MAG: divergent polysaccharide deacetylase family protein, partial [Proteobacteria bacterium]|nr:divergent polysaccharide deacetylase family protein [Pseudomonadota bacterium]